MSHYAVLVIGDYPEEQLEKYDENIAVEPYCAGEVSEREKKRMIDFYSTKKQKKYTSFEECYLENGEDWDGNVCRLEDGVWMRYSTYNPDSKWDWYVLGGRWSGEFIKLKENGSGTIGVSGAFGNRTGVDQAYKRDIDFANIDRSEFIPYAVVYNGEWISRGEMGWWGVTLEENFTQEEWEKRVWELIESTSGETLFSFYDLHI